MMETQAQQTEQGNSSSPQDSGSFSGADNSRLPQLPAAKESESQWQQIIRQIVEFLNRLPDYVGSVFNNNKKGLTTVVLILSAFVTVKVAIALLDAVNDFPLLQPILELIGLFYSIWFTFRYLIKYETRQELAQKFNAFKQESLG
ncbi:CAAD domain-containing protein [Dolichospermum sp. UHCC 0259]|uniref:CAAD domain-containing protein n=1 Tax=Dolichospermum sp. UHCC 0259 TaxID=2590010 RepID=UPI00352BB3D8